MYRRRRPFKRETDFGFDSFLDVVANVIGIIIRFIIVAWVGARFYTATLPVDMTRPAPPDADKREIVLHPLRRQIEETESVLAKSKSQLLDYLRDLESLHNDKAAAKKELAAVVDRHRRIASQEKDLAGTLKTQRRRNERMKEELAELRERSKSVADRIDNLAKKPKAKKLRYRVPVSEPVVLEELMFECRGGRVTFIDLRAFRREIRRELQDAVETLKKRWSVAKSTRRIGSFRMHYKLERHRSRIDELAGKPPSGSFGYGLRWVLEPIDPLRGETIDQAARPESKFRRLVKTVVPGETVFTFCVYPDSFALYRQLRDFLYEQGFEVAGRPFPHGVPIAASPKGTRSRGQ